MTTTLINALGNHSAGKSLEGKRRLPTRTRSARTESIVEALEARTMYSRVPIGWVDEASTNQISGWACDPNNSGAAINVEVDISGGPANQIIAADVNRADLKGTLGSINHAFALPTPMLTVGAHTVQIFALGLNGSKVLLGTRTIVSPNSMFDEHYYLLNNPDVAAAVAHKVVKSGYDHFIAFGQYEGRKPNATWNEAAYLQGNPDVAAAVKAHVVSSGFMHYYLYGQYEGRMDSSVNISVRYGNELVISANGTADFVGLSQNGTMLTIQANGIITTRPVPAGGVFIYARGGHDSVSIDGSVQVFATVDAIDGSMTTIQSGDALAAIWMDSTDTLSGTGFAHRVSSFAGGVSKAAGASLANPSDTGKVQVINASLMGTCPAATDINQGSVGDCYFLASLAGFASDNNFIIRQSAVDLGDGTYAVQFFNQGTPSYVRVNNEFAAGYFDGWVALAHQGASGAIWGMVMEKAYAYFRYGSNTYDSISGGWMGDVYDSLNVANSWLGMGTASELYNKVSTALASGKPVTFDTCIAGTQLVGGHAYTLISAAMDSQGVARYVVRNPWGQSGDKLENSGGYATLTYAQMVQDFAEGCVAL